MRARPVLIVDDEEDTRESLRELLELEGYAVLTARDGREALERMRASRPGLVLLDLYMPVMDGAEVCARRLADPDLRSIPVVAVSAAADLDDALADLEVEGRLEKPVRIGALLEAVARHCR